MPAFLPPATVIDFELDTMLRYLDHLESALQQEKESVRSRLENMAAGFSREELEIFYGYFEDEIYEFEFEFPRLLYSGFIVSWYSFVEYSLLNLCDQYDLSISVSAFENINLGRGIQRARKLLLLAKEYEIPQEIWQEVRIVNKIRNMLVHEGGRIPTTLKKPKEIKDRIHELELPNDVTIYLDLEANLYDYLNQYSLIAIRSILARIHPTKDFCLHVVGLARKLFHTIYAGLGEPP